MINFKTGLFLIICSLLFSNYAKSQDKIYLTNINNPQIQRCNMDGTELESIDFDVNFGHPEDIEIDTLRKKIYWTDRIDINDGNPGIIRKANLDGSDVQSMYYGGNPRRLWLDSENEIIYWTDDVLGSIMKADMNLENQETLSIDMGLNGAIGIDIDLQAEIIYWSDYEEDRLWKANLDGSDQTLLYSSSSNLGTIKLSKSKEYLYCTDNIGGVIFRLDVDGTNRVDLFTGLDNVNMLDLDFNNTTIYWQENYVNGGTSQDICLKRANLNDLVPEVITPSNVDDVYFGIELSIDGSNTTSSYEAVEDKSIAVFPNPFVNEVYIDGLFNEFEYKLYRVDGTLVDSGTAQNSINFKPNVSAGWYTLMIKVDEEWVYKKLSKF